MAQEPVDGTQVKVRGLSEQFLREIGMESVESTKELETESEISLKPYHKEETPLSHSKISQC